jgi:hypothetical protein
MLSVLQIVWYTSFSEETVKLNIHLEQKLHFFTTEQWTMPWIDSFVLKVSPKSFTDTRLAKASPLVGAYKSNSWAFHEYLETTHIS